MDAQSDSCPSLYRKRYVVAREIDLFKTISPFELSQRAIIFCAIDVFAVNEALHVLAFANLHRVRQDLNQHSNSVDVNDFNESNQCVAIKRADELTALKVRFVLHLHSREILSEMPKLLPLADRCFVIDSLDSAHEVCVERDRSDVDPSSLRASNVFARFLRKFLPPILEAQC